MLSQKPKVEKTESGVEGYEDAKKREKEEAVRELVNFSVVVNDRFVMLHPETMSKINGIPRNFDYVPHGVYGAHQGYVILKVPGYHAAMLGPDTKENQDLLKKAGYSRDEGIGVPTIEGDTFMHRGGIDEQSYNRVADAGRRQKEYEDRKEIKEETKKDARFMTDEAFLKQHGKTKTQFAAETGSKIEDTE